MNSYSYIEQHFGLADSMNAVYCVEESTNGWLNMSSIFVAFAIVALQRYGEIPFIKSFSGDGEEGIFKVVVQNMIGDGNLTECFAFSQGSGSYWIDLIYYKTKNKCRTVNANECSSLFSYGDGLHDWLNDFLDKAEEFPFKD